MSSQDKSKVNAVEPFDEWEEFALFASHYFVLVATNGSSEPRPLTNCLKKKELESPRLHLYPRDDTAGNKSESHLTTIPNVNMRRFGALLSVSDNVFGHHGGLGCQSRLASLDLYGIKDCQNSKRMDFTGIEPRMCHTISAVSPNSSLLVGGRTSPSRALKDCWILGEHLYRVEDLPQNLYRHCAVEVEFGYAGQICSGVLVYGGKTGESMISNQWLLWRKGVGWARLEVPNHTLEPRFGAAMTSIESHNGLLVGGMDAEGKILSEIWEWSISDGETGICIGLKHTKVGLDVSGSMCLGEKGLTEQDNFSLPLEHVFFNGFGASLVNSPFGILLIGGVSAHPIVQGLEILRLTKSVDTNLATDIWHCAPLQSHEDHQLPLLVGHTAFIFHGAVVLVGGGAVCFSFGTYWNRAMHIISDSAELKAQIAPLVSQSIQYAVKSNPSNTTTVTKTNGKINESIIESTAHFDQIVHQNHPVIIRGSRFGNCVEEWSPENLKLKLGSQRMVST